mmetsp:Transcript_36732/g.64381  ORF Transcript_36732/g.64381 Transcript_36732/m.64381 type:complete len:315 (+) Transcript_36732:3487-4431(+)
MDHSLVRLLSSWKSDGHLLARSQQKGVDFQVSQKDLDLAVAAMERNMKEGLERRQMKDSSSVLTDTSHRSSLCKETKNKIFSPMRVSFETTPDDRAKMPNDSRKRQTTNEGTDEESQLDMASRPSAASDIPVSDVLKDIARRSTRFQDESYMEKMRRMADRPLSEQILDDISDSADICSDGEIEVTKDRERVFRRRRSSAVSKAIKNGKRMTTTDDDLDCRLTGHFTPGRGGVDIGKVRSVILNNQEEPRRRADGEVTVLNARLSQQGRLMEQLMAKIDLIENRTKSAITFTCSYSMHWTSTFNHYQISQSEAD